MNAEIRAEPIATARREGLAAVRNAFKLGVSLIGTWSVALLVRIFLPRFLGPEQFGVYNFADSFAATFFVVIGLGVDLYIHKEVPVRPEHASDFFGGIFLVRLLMSVFLIGIMAAVLLWTDRSEETRELVYVFSLAQIVVTLNGTLSALLHARSAIDGVALFNIASKFIWAGGILLGLLAGYGLMVIAVAMLVSELVKTVALGFLTRKHLALKVNMAWAKTWSVIVSSMPFYLNMVAMTAYAKLNVSMLSFLTSDFEVGLYGASHNLASLALLITPLISWVLLPLISRAAARSDEEMTLLVRRAMELILIVAIPTSLALGVGADVWMTLAFGQVYAPASLGLRILAPMFVLTYVATVSACCLILMKRAWTVTLVSIAGLLINALFNYLMIPPAQRALGVGGAGAGAATALISTEFMVAVAMTLFLGRRAFDKRSWTMLAKTAFACVSVIALDFWLRDIGWGPKRLWVEAGLYCVLVFGTGAIRVKEMVEFVRSAIQRRNHAI